MKIYNQILITLFLLPTLAFAQNSSSKSYSERSIIRPYAEFCVNFLNNEAIINRYNNTSLFYAGLRTYLGRPKHNFNLFDQYSVSNFIIINNGNS
jgi:hypothetical protein